MCRLPELVETDQRMKPTFDLDLLRTFVALAHHRSFAQTGVHMGRTQSAITQQMQKLEAQLGRPLFQKDGRGKRLTEYGHHLLRYAQDLLALNDDAMLALQEMGNGGLLRLGSPHDIADSTLPKILSHTVRYLPNLQLDIQIGRSPELMEALHRGELDMTLSTRKDEALEGFLLHSSPTLWLCGATYVHNPQLPLPVILGDGPSIFRRYALNALERHRLDWRLVYTSASPIGIKSAVRAGLGVTPRSMELLSEDVRILGEKDGLPPLPDVNYYLWIRPGSVNPLARQAFELLKSARNTISPPRQTN